MANEPDTILVVDDEPVNLKVLFDYLQQVGFKVLVALDARTAFESIGYLLPDLILLDIRLPEMDGFEICRRLKADPVTHDIPVLFITVTTEVAEKVKGLELGAADFISKPIWVEEVAARVRTHLNLRHLQQQLEADIAERKRVEAILRENQARLDLALHSAEMGVWQLELTSNRRSFDEQACRLLGIDPAAFQGTSEELYRLVHPDDRETLQAALKRTIEQDVLYEPEYRVVWPDGTRHYIAARARLFRDEAGRLLRINGILWDVTERKRAEEELKRFAAELERSNQELEQLNALPILQKPLPPESSCYILFRVRVENCGCDIASAYESARRPGRYPRCVRLLPPDNASMSTDWMPAPGTI